MFPIIPTLALAFLSFACSFFVILRVVIPILPPGPFSKRVSPSEFGLPNFKTLSPADKSHIWLALCDLIALSLFIWEAVNEAVGGAADRSIASDPGAAARVWAALTIRQTCLLVVASLTLLHVRMGRTVSFGSKQWMLWVPTAVLVVASTVIAAVLAGIATPSFFIGLISYSAALSALSSVSFGCLIGTLFLIRRNIARLEEVSDDAWPPARPIEEKPRPSFATEDVDGLRDGSSWVTSTAGSRRDSISAFSFSTHHTQHSRKISAAGSFRSHMNAAAMASHPSIPGKSSFWFGPATPHNGQQGQETAVPPVPRLPAPYRPASPTSADVNDDPDPFRRAAPSPELHHGKHQRGRVLGSQTSWLTSNSGTHTTLTAWSFPATARAPTPALSEQSHRSPTADVHTDLLPTTTTAASRPITPAMSTAQVLGGYGYAPEAAEAERGPNASVSTTGSDVDVSVYRAIGWLVSIWVPMGLSLPYLIAIASNVTISSPVLPILMVLSVTLSSPILACNIIFRSPLPIPSGLFENFSEPPSVVNRAPSPASSTSTARVEVYEYKRSCSVTVVEGRRSGDVWIAHGDAVEGKSKIGRAAEMLRAKPKLSVMPFDVKLEGGPITPPLPMQEGPLTPLAISMPIPQKQEEEQEQEQDADERKRKESKASSYYSGVDASVHHASRIMIAQRHYSAVATTLVVPPSPENKESGAWEAGRRASSDSAGAHVVTGVAITKDSSTPPHAHAGQHLRARSISSTVGGRDSPISPPPSSPLPPTPPTLKNARLGQLMHRKSHSSGLEREFNYSFGPIAGDNSNEIDALSAGLLPLLMPGVKIGKENRITGEWAAPPTPAGTMTNRRTRKSVDLTSLVERYSSFGTFESPEEHSTPVKVKAARTRKTSSHKKQHMSLPSLGLGKDGTHSLKADIDRALTTDGKLQVSAATEDGRRNTVMGAEARPHTLSHLHTVREEGELLRADGRTVSASTFGHGRPSTTGFADVPNGINTARSSLITLLEQPIPQSAASDVTLFDLSEEGPMAESTPHDSKTKRISTRREDVPPVPAVPSRRSSIMYIRPDEPTNTTTTTTSPAPRRSSIVYRSATDRHSQSQTNNENAAPDAQQWTPRAVRPLRPKASRLAGMSPAGAASPGSPGGGLRPLSLLQERDQNQGSAELPGTRPLAFGRKKNGGGASAAGENGPGAQKRSLRPLALSRSDTSKLRGLLRKTEALPAVVVRPPSASEHAGFE